MSTLLADAPSIFPIMKPRTILACFFAAFGLYLSLTALFGLGYAISMATSILQLENNAGRWMLLHQSIASLTPLIMGILLLILSRRAGALCARFAGVPEDAHWDLKLSARELCATLLVATGCYLAIMDGAQLIRSVIAFIVSQAGSPVIGEAVTRGIPTNSDLIVFVVRVIAGVLLVKQSRRISAALGF